MTEAELDMLTGGLSTVYIGPAEEMPEDDEILELQSQET